MKDYMKAMIRLNLRRVTCGLLIVTLLGVCFTTNIAHALPQPQKTIMDAGILRFDIAESSLCPANSGSDIPNGTTEENKRAVFDFFVGKGLQPFQAAGIIGNMVIESGVLPQRLQGTSADAVTTAEQYVAKFRDLPPERQLGWGVVQFTPAFKFIDNAPSVHDANSLGAQLDFIWQQLEGGTPSPEKQAGIDIKSTTNLTDAVLAWQGNSKVGGKYTGYERPRDQAASVTDRVREARLALQAFGNGATIPDPSGSTIGSGLGCAAGGSDNANVGGYSLPVDQKFFDQNPEWFSKPHHDYPSADIPVATGTKVYAAAAGKITKAPIVDTGCQGCVSGSYGRGVKIDVGNGITMIYGHGLDGGTIPGAHEGDTVKAGQLIMHSDSTGHSTGPHLHFEIQVNGTPVCPQTWLTAIGNQASTIPDITALPRSGCTN